MHLFHFLRSCASASSSFAAFRSSFYAILPPSLGSSSLPLPHFHRHNSPSHIPFLSSHHMAKPPLSPFSHLYPQLSYLQLASYFLVLHLVQSSNPAFKSHHSHFCNFQLLLHPLRHRQSLRAVHHCRPDHHLVQLAFHTQGHLSVTQQHPTPFSSCSILPLSSSPPLFRCHRPPATTYFPAMERTIKLKIVFATVPSSVTPSISPLQNSSFEDKYTSSMSSITFSS